MIDGYKFRDGKIIVVNYDEDNEITEEEWEYQDNIEELLRALNMEEHLNNLKDKAETDIRNYEANISYCKNDISNTSFLIIAFTGCGAIISLIPMNPIPCILAFLASFIFFGIKTIIPAKIEISKSKEIIKGTELFLEGIEEEIKKNQKDLRRLRSDDRKECENIRSEYKQFDLKELDEVDKYLDLWYQLGIDEEDYLYGYKNDVLNAVGARLGKNFSQEDVKTLKRIISSRNKRR